MTDLPPEILCEIAAKCDILTQMRLAATCRRLRKRIRAQMLEKWPFLQHRVGIPTIRDFADDSLADMFDLNTALEMRNSAAKLHQFAYMFNQWLAFWKKHFEYCAGQQLIKIKHNSRLRLSGFVDAMIDPPSDQMKTHIDKIIRNFVEYIH